MNRDDILAEIIRIPQKILIFANSLYPANLDISIIMKKIFFLVLMSLCISGMKANIIMPRAWISEIFVEGPGNWSIELGFHEYEHEDVDSIRLVTSSGNSVVTYYSLIWPGYGESEFDSIAVITNENLGNPLTINLAGDFVRVISYVWGSETYDYVVFGEYPGSFLNCIHEGESVCDVWHQGFCIDNIPNIGAGDDGFGHLSNFSGMVYDLSGNPVNSGMIHLPGPWGTNLYTDEGGMFDDIVFSHRYAYDTVELWIPPWPYTRYEYTVEPFDFCVRPDSSHYQDIIFTSLVLGTDTSEKFEENIVTIAPNPFSNLVVFYFNIKENNDDDLTFNIYSLDGRNIAQFSILPGQTRLEWIPSALTPSGTYIYRLDKQNKTLKTGKFVKL